MSQYNREAIIEMRKVGFEPKFDENQEKAKSYVEISHSRKIARQNSKFNKKNGKQQHTRA